MTHVAVDRRQFFGTFAAGAGAALTLAAAGPAAADNHGGGAAAACATMTPDLQKTITPDQAIEMLKEGNARFVA